MPLRKLLEIKNEFKSNMELDLEPVPETYVLEPGGALDVVASSDITRLSLRFGMLEDGLPYVSVWDDSPGQGKLRFERNGRNVFD